MSLYVIYEPAPRRRTEIRGNFKIERTRGIRNRPGSERIIKQGAFIRYPTLTPVIRAAGVSTKFDPRALITTATGFVVYSPRAYTGYLHPDAQGWLMENPSWPPKRPAEEDWSNG